MITYFDLIQRDDFRNFVLQRLAKAKQDSQYSFPLSFPPLYKYRSLSKYAVDDIICGHITATSIGDFNDLFDGTMHMYGTEEECVRAAEKKWDELECVRIAAGQPKDLLTRNYYVKQCTKHFMTESRLKFRLLDYLGTYVCCFSSRCDSTLMWAHYAASNTGICVEYDFNILAHNSLQKKTIFPVAYSEKPIDLRDLLDDEKGKVFQYPLDAAVLCAALNKANIWAYENEWRLVAVLASAKVTERRIPICAPVPTSISLGYHFIKPFFYYDFNNKQEREDAKAIIKEAVRLLDYIEKQRLAVFVTTPVIGEYGLVRRLVEINKLKSFMNRHFADNTPENIRFYHVVHDKLMDILEKEQ